MTNQKKTKLPYYEADTGFFEHKVKICFTDKAFQTAIQKAKITTKHSALDIGVAESHHITQEGTQNVLVAIVFNLEEMRTYDPLEKMGIIEQGYQTLWRFVDDVIVERGASVRITGMVSGRVVSLGGAVEMRGMVAG